MNKPKKYKNSNKVLEEKINTFLNGLYGNCEVAKSWWLMMAEFLNGLPVDEKKEIKKFIFDAMEDMEEELDEELQIMEQKYFPNDT